MASAVTALRGAGKWLLRAWAPIGAVVTLLAAVPAGPAVADEAATNAVAPSDQPAAAIETVDTDPSRLGTVVLVVENDIFANTDQNYSNGLKLSYIGNWDVLPNWADWARDRLQWMADDATWRFSFSLGQNMYTPRDIDTASPLPDQRPYAGWLYTEVAMSADSEDRLDTLALNLGIVGPSANADYVQQRWHKLINAVDPLGWDNQLRDEPTVNLLYERKWRKEAISLGGISVDFTPHIAGALGNASIYAAAGGSMRVGTMLDADYGPTRIRPAISGAGKFGEPVGWGWYVFAGTELRAVGRDIFVQGNTFRDSLGLDLMPLVADFQFGATAKFGWGKLAYTHVIRTEQYRGQPGPDKFGALTFSLDF